MMCLIRYRMGDTPTRLKLYTDYYDLIEDEFSPDYEIIEFVSLTLCGSYAEQKKTAEDIAARLRTIDDGSLTYSDYEIIAGRLQRIARKTGSIRLFREKGLIS